MAKKDPSKDAKFDTDMDSMLDRYDSGIGDFFEEDIKGADKDRGPVKLCTLSVVTLVKQVNLSHLVLLKVSIEKLTRVCQS